MIAPLEYATRRQTLARKLPEGSLAIIPAADEVHRNGDAHYRFRQDSHFYYLTGFNEPEAVLIIVAGTKGDCVLFNRARNPSQEQWTGKRLGQDDVLKTLHIHEAFAIDTFSSRLPELIADKTAIYFDVGRHPAYEQQFWQALKTVKGRVRQGVAAPHTVCDLDPFISEMRLIKSKAEISLMQKAADISVLGHQKAMQQCRHLEWEYQLEAELVYEFSRHGCRALAYDPIVGAGENTCILHYTENNQRLRQGDLVLIDAAGEFENYAADITRTFPVSGRFSAEQRAIYELVLLAQQAGIASVKPGVAWNTIQQTMVRIMTVGLCDLGLLKGNVDHLIEQEAYKPFYMHNSGHWLGLDVHDSGQYKMNKEWRLLEPGMALTVEPGIYITPNIPGVDPRWWNIGVRIEDDILVTPEGCHNFTQALPTNIHDVEALVRG